MAIEAMVIREVEVVSESPFYIPMTGPAARPRRALKHDDTFRCARHGDIQTGQQRQMFLWANDL
jgi:hypothetical protein